MPRSRNGAATESFAHQWGQLKQYEEDGDGGPEPASNEVTEAVSIKKRVKQFKEGSSRTFASLKSQISGIYRFIYCMKSKYK